MNPPRDPKGYTALINPHTGRMELTLAVIPMPGDSDYHPKSILNYIRPKDILLREPRKSMHDRRVPQPWERTVEDATESAMDSMKIDRVRARLSRWADYYEHRSSSQPCTSAYSVADQVADEIYRFRRPTLSINTPDPKLDLRISDSEIVLLCRLAEQRQKPKEFTLK